MRSDPAAPGGAGLKARFKLLAVRPQERAALVFGFLLLFLLFTSYFMLRPVRETFGIAGGVRNLQWLFTATFVATLVVVPVYGWVAARLPRRRLLPVSYTFSAVVMAGFAVSLWLDPGSVWVGRAFYVWVSVFNLFVISIAWSLLSDLLDKDQSQRMYGQIAAGASLGGLTGPLLSGLLVAPLGEAGLLFLSTALLLSTLACVAALLRWRDRLGPRTDVVTPERIGGSIWGGLKRILASPYLLSIAVFVLLLTSVSTFLYFEQARIVAETFPDRTRQTQVFSAIDAVVQASTIFIQLFLTGLLARRLGVVVLLTAVPVTMVLGFGLLAFVATFPALVFVMVVRRVGEYALVRPGREMLFAPLDAETKYKAKNAIDTFVYRGGDALSAWLNTAVSAIGVAGAAAVMGALIAGCWAMLGARIGRLHDRGRGEEGRR
ncbi:MFS transporter [Pseudothauera nasutitermitis]|uniref:MFS transporter n=1 Tax=Pseudothauera nasutitermitis TaxID=2565930 RepID=A0A4S4AZJ5_9RHOO|nr:MFS transporter [Pseudothauera nasutitermitis]THF64781.1 MFS transporter [Pseudothauera nasutitermitis]